MIFFKQLTRVWFRDAATLVLALACFLAIGASPVAVAQAPADQATPAQRSAQPEGKSAADVSDAPKAEQKSEADETAQFRHSPSVKWFARLLHVDVETAATIFEYFNFAVVVFAIGIPLFRMLPKIFRKRASKLNADLETAQAMTDDANDRLRAIESKLAGLDAEIGAIRSQVEEQMRTDEANSKTAIEQETARIVAAAEQEIVMAGVQTQRALKEFAANLAIDRALSQLTLDAETDRMLIDEFAHSVAGRGKRKRSAEGSQN